MQTFQTFSPWASVNSTCLLPRRIMSSVGFADFELHAQFFLLSRFKRLMKNDYAARLRTFQRFENLSRIVAGLLATFGYIFVKNEKKEQQSVFTICCVHCFLYIDLLDGNITPDEVFQHHDLSRGKACVQNAFLYHTHSDTYRIVCGCDVQRQHYCCESSEDERNNRYKTDCNAKLDQREIDNLHSTLLCQRCRERTVQLSFRPCGCAYLCIVCAFEYLKNKDACSFCRVKIHGHTKVILN